MWIKWPTFSIIGLCHDIMIQDITSNHYFLQRKVEFHMWLCLLRPGSALSSCKTQLSWATGARTDYSAANTDTMTQAVHLNKCNHKYTCQSFKSTPGPTVKTVQTRCMQVPPPQFRHVWVNQPDEPAEDDSQKTHRVKLSSEIVCIKNTWGKTKWAGNMKKKKDSTSRLAGGEVSSCWEAWRRGLSPPIMMLIVYRHPLKEQSALL